LVTGWQTEETLHQLMDACDTLNHPVFLHDHDFRILFANRAYLNHAKASYEDILGMPYWQVFPRAQGPLSSCLRALTEGAEEEVEDITTDSNETFCCRALAIHGADGEYLYSVHLLEDVTERRRLEEALRREQALSEATIQCAPGVFYVLDIESRFIRWNRYVNRITNLSDDALLQTSALSIVHPDDRPRIAAKIQEVFSSGYAEAEARLVTMDKGLRNFSFTGQRFEVDGSIYLAGYGVDITELKRAWDQLEHLATHDRLTGLPNRNLFFDRLQHGLDKAARHGEHLAVMFVDLDNFKLINDSFGHQMGDSLLTQVAEHLQACTRKQDTVSRLGGDEFTVIVEDIRESSEEIVAATAERIIQALAAPFDLGAHQALLSASVGIAFYPKDGTDVTTLLRSADAAMYKAKEIGKNNYQFFTAEMNIHAAERRALESDLRGALERGEFFLVYQPQVNLRSAHIISVEALLRWMHPQKGLLLPDEFIPLAEATGLIVPIGDWVLRGVCAQLREWSGRGLRSIRVAVNLSPRQFRQADLADTIQSILRENGISASSLEFELTETCVMDDAASATEILHRLKDMGVGLAIDDFGMGYSSLQYLKRFPIDNLKIDSHFIKDLATDLDDQAIVSAIITMGHSLRLDVIAEGVETQQQLDFLRINGCDLVQGHYLNRPLSAQRTAEVIGSA
jgi:diguanylate cyclase (GGDEF)-like protein/PAS domain S-box-containing protein